LPQAQKQWDNQSWTETSKSAIQNKPFKNDGGDELSYDIL
jgi:hypothetical protein